MKRLQQFLLPIIGLTKQSYQFDFQIDKSFFDCFEDSFITDGNFNVTLLFEKKPGMLLLDFDFEGKASTECDRCLAAIQLPLKDKQRLIVKYSETPKEGDDEIVYIHPEASHLDVAQYIYEYICVAMPLNKVYACEDDVPQPCDTKTLAYLNTAATIAEQEVSEAKSAVWDSLKDKFKE